MTGINPTSMIPITKWGGFDFPILIHANGCLPNIDPGGSHPHVETWYGKLGNPKRQQGWPVIVETIPEIEDPQVSPWIDLIVDIDHPVTLFTTGRISGNMAIELADNTHFSRIIVTAVPYKTRPSGLIPHLLDVTQPLVPGPNAPNNWFWFTAPPAGNELLQTRKIQIDNPPIHFQAGEVYKLLVEWEFYHTVNGVKHHEPFCGFDDSITFKVNQPTIV